MINYSNYYKFALLVTLIFTIFSNLFAQNGIIKGRVFNNINNEPIPFANIYINEIERGISSDFEGNFIIKDVMSGTYNVTFSFIGYQTYTASEVIVAPNKPTTINAGLIETTTSLEEIEIKASPFTKSEESPVSKRNISATEIYRNPGGNRDISKVIQSLPGVASTVSFRNDIIIRGGAPNENRFYLDGIEVPNINHFATQGSSGGPVGMINVNFISEVDLYSGAFPANRGNTLSSVLEFKQVEGNNERLASSFTIGSSDIGLTLDGPIGKKSTFVLSARRSYLQFLFKAIQLPFLPTYNDIQFKQSIKLNEKNNLTFIGLGAIDEFKLNLGLNENISDPDTYERNEYILGYLPVSTQWNYTFGGKWTHFKEHSFQTLVISRNHLNNTSKKYAENVETNQNLLQDYNSQEIENKLRFENTLRKNGWKLNFGFGYEYAEYTNSTFLKIPLGDSNTIVDFESDLAFHKFSYFAQGSKKLINNKLILSLGVRADHNSYSKQMANPIKQLSPRFSAAYALTNKMSLNFNVGRYYQLPAYTVMGYRDNNNLLVNKENEITYISNDHIVAGLEFNPATFNKITIEGFYKNYNNYPFLVNKNVSLANLGGDFGVIGNEEVTSSSQGRAYGVEFLAQQKLSKSFYGILAYTWVRSEFKDQNNNYKPSAWDNGNIISLTAGKKFKKNWEIGVKFRFSGGSPYTPFDTLNSSYIQVWDVANMGLLDYNQLNELRLKANHGLDIRIDKKWYWKKMALNLYLDIQNAYNFQSETAPSLIVPTDDNGNRLINSNDPSRYQTKLIENVSGTLLPSIGLQFEF
ncbi:MAG: TonB-dependent receptor [Flavobacteriales bacterium]|nr:TonB-dependent receptor [Flavobacteriales bacterium]